MEKRIEVKAIAKGANTESRSIEVVANSGQPDRMNERVPAASVRLETYLKNPVVLWAHQYDQPPIGKAMNLRADGDALLSTIQFAETEFAEDVFQLYRGGFLSAVSLGFIGKQFSQEVDQPLTWTEAELLEISAVPVPADPGALVRRMKALGYEARQITKVPDFRNIPSVEQLINEVLDTADWLKTVAGWQVHQEAMQGNIRKAITTLESLLPSSAEPVLTVSNQESLTVIGDDTAVLIERLAALKSKFANITK